MMNGDKSPSSVRVDDLFIEEFPPPPSSLSLPLLTPKTTPPARVLASGRARTSLKRASVVGGLTALAGLLALGLVLKPSRSSKKVTPLQRLFLRFGLAL